MLDLTWNSIRRAALASALVLGAAACGLQDDAITGVVSSNPDGGGTNGTVALSILAGNNQTGPTGANLPDSLAVSLTTGGQPTPGATVTWTVLTGSALVGSSTSVTNAQGIARTIVAVGSLPERSTIRASVAAGATVEFTVIGR